MAFGSVGTRERAHAVRQHAVQIRLYDERVYRLGSHLGRYLRKKECRAGVSLRCSESCEPSTGAGSHSPFLRNMRVV